LAKAILVLTLNGFEKSKDLKNCGFKTKKGLKHAIFRPKILRPFFRPKRSKDLKILILDEAKFQFLRS